MKLFLSMMTCLLLLATSVAHSACTEAAEPLLPDPDVAVMEDILRAQSAVKHYLVRQETFLSCINNNNRHDAAVDKMHDVAAQYNNMARRYKSRMKSMNMVVDLALLI